MILAIGTKKNQSFPHSSVLFPLLAIIFFLSACTGTTGNCPRTCVSNSHFLNLTHTHPTPDKSRAEHGIDLTISKRSSLSIDIECILDYVQGEISMIDKNASVANNTPWIYWVWHY